MNISEVLSAEVSPAFEQKQEKGFFKGIILAVIAVVCSSCIMPFVNLYEDVPLAMIGVWRYQLNFLYCIPITLYLWKKNKKSLDYNEIFTWTTLSEILIAASLTCIGSTISFVGSKETLVSHVTVLCNSGGVLLIIANIIMMIAVNRFEIIGTCGVVVGIIMLISDNSSKKLGGETNILYGDFLCIISMPMFTLAFIFNSRAIRKLPSLIVFHCFCLIQLCYFGVYCLTTYNVSTSELFSRDPQTGFFGWTQPQWLPLSTLVITPICGIIGVGSYIFMLDYFPVHIVAGMFLMKPFTAQILGCILGQDGLPSLGTYVGTTIISIGLGLTIFGSLKTQEEEIKKLEDYESLEMSLIEC